MTDQTLIDIKARIDKIDAEKLKDALSYAIFNANNDYQDLKNSDTFRNIAKHHCNELLFILRVAEKD